MEDATITATTRTDAARGLGLRMSPLGSAAPEGVDGPGAGDNLPAMRESFWNEILLPRFDGSAAATISNV